MIAHNSSYALDVVAEVVHGNNSSENVGWDSNIEQVEESSHRNDVETSTTKGTYTHLQECMSYTKEN
jgi:hypothetical protein